MAPLFVPLDEDSEDVAEVVGPAVCVVDEVIVDEPVVEVEVAIKNQSERYSLKKTPRLTPDPPYHAQESLPPRQPNKIHTYQ